ncbi:MAG TPA: ethanolamine ammonia-lyase reactivating factor EutA [Chloroflexota bacterium]|jgi:ethanolamine utilization protein EutA|nr:ethanolamine ammonia-lyase reactivating factor EutA [Chloroflexota bacterium]
MHDDHDYPDHVHWHGAVAAGHVEAVDIEGLEMFKLRSVGIDIGSSTSHLIFSRLTLRREGASLSAQFKVSEREVLYRSNIMLTPYRSSTLIDTDRLREFFLAEYASAGFTADDVDTGAVVITGEALKKENAQPISEMFQRSSGRFICASAGPNHEALLAAYGSGSVAMSSEYPGMVLNVDVGGGTSKLSLISNGAVLQTVAVNVGSRLLAFDESGRATRVEDVAKLIMRTLGRDVAVGDVIDDELRDRFSGVMADVLFDVIRGGPISRLTRELMITNPLEGAADLHGVQAIVFSGGTSEYVYHPDTPNFGDLGTYFAGQIRERLDQPPCIGLLHAPTEGIRATVIGAGEYTIQVSGNTSYLSNIEALPMFGLKVIQVARGYTDLPLAIARALEKFDMTEIGPGIAIALSIPPQPNYSTLRRIAEDLKDVADRSSDASSPLLVVLDLDVAKSLGGILKEELGLARDLIAIDGIDVGDLDYIDIGRPVGASEALPVTVKSLMFPTHAEVAAVG